MKNPQTCNYFLFETGCLYIVLAAQALTGWPPGLELRFIHLCLSSAWIKGTHHHTLQICNFFCGEWFETGSRVPQASLKQVI